MLAKILTRLYYAPTDPVAELAARKVIQRREARQRYDAKNRKRNRERKRQWYATNRKRAIAYSVEYRRQANQK